MTLPNRVDPFGTLFAHPARGTLMGNRGGRFHDPVLRALTRRRWAGPRWLCCSLSYPGRNRHPVWSRGYTQLFFLDEVTALAAGHRPCAECRRADALAFRTAAGRGATRAFTSFPDLDAQLHAERLEGYRRRPTVDGADLPDGSCIAQDGAAFVRRDGRRLAWSPDGYATAGRWPAGPVQLLTPPISVRALRAGFRPLWHPSA